MKFLRKFPYWYLIAVPVLLFGLGMASNEAVFITNHGKFPVMMNEAQYSRNCTASEETKGAPPSACVNGGQMLDYRHSIMGPNTHMKVLADIFPIAGFTYSIGDGFLAASEWLFSFTPYMWLILTIRKLAKLVD
jgi:Family of unknown function (DUF5317)